MDLWTESELVSAVYDLLQVASSRHRYRLSVGNYRGSTGEECLVEVLSLLSTGKQMLGHVYLFCQ